MRGLPIVRIFLLFAAGYFLSYAFRSLGSIIAPDLMRELSLNARELGFLASVYFLAFFVVQAPIGIAMDRYGPARVNGVLFGVAAAGSAVFAAGTGFYTLMLGRALIGLGVAGALMTSFKAFVIWYEPRHREALTGAITAVGGLAAMVSASPAEWAMRAMSWRGLFWVLAAACLVTSAALLLAAPGPGATPRGAGAAADGGYARILRSRIFLSYAPLAFFSSGGFSAIQSLWAGPWLIEVAGHSRESAAGVLFNYGFSLLLGNLLIGAAGAAMQNAPHAPRRWYVGSLAAAVASLGLVIANAFPGSSLPWVAYGVTLGAGMLAYPALTRAFPVSIAGRVVTSYNMVMFLGGFAIQSGMGVAIQAFADAGWTRAAAFQATFAGLLAAQVAALAWFVALSRDRDGDRT
ncbi:MAG: MFS transporter [Burkholderiales bacterium]|nr:MFS transporter [Burkholderiales bacterium]